MTKLLTVAAVAERLSVSRRTVYRMVHAGELPPVVAGPCGGWRFDADTFEAWLAQEIRNAEWRAVAARARRL